ncbi:hypothetical protein ACEQPO_06400 [Bacillus sp. SL00103]
MTGLVMYMAVVSMGMNVDVRIVLGIFAIASIGGLISMVPGGFGSLILSFFTEHAVHWVLIKRWY